MSDENNPVDLVILWILVQKYSGVRGAMNCATTNAFLKYSGVRGAMNCATTNERGAAPKCKRRNELRDYERKRRGSQV